MPRVAFTFKSLPPCAGLRFIAPSNKHFASFVPPAFFLSFISFIFTSRLPTVLRAVSFHRRSHLCLCLAESCATRKSTKGAGTQMKLGRASLWVPVSSPGRATAILPPCEWRTSGTERQSAPDTKSLSRSRCLLPLDICPWDGAGWTGKWRGRQEILEGDEGGRGEGVNLEEKQERGKRGYTKRNLRILIKKKIKNMHLKTGFSCWSGRDFKEKLWLFNSLRAGSRSQRQRMSSEERTEGKWAPS